jgi:hypothetical protein
MNDLHTGLSGRMDNATLDGQPMLIRQDSKPIQSPTQTPTSKKRKLDSVPKTPEAMPRQPQTPATIRLDDDGEELPGQEHIHRQHDEYNKMRKFKMVPYDLSDHLSHNVFVKSMDGTFEPLKIKGETYILETMSKDDLRSGIQAYNQDGEKMESDKLFNGGSKRKRRTRKKKISRRKRRSTVRRK